ncbi:MULTISPECIES: 16S rRNA (guanine(527)-N(7))-methyltransferase RsmG [Atopobiaceae]|uniref:Ribosomal RNA small subunit methyltransferase G n=1 Tax=Parafannyhessea umbonata TaxID=604330 RepID=A0A1H6IGH1_9ACTN|nr:MULTISPECIES: 16S rRNA (guanine(527)-N(7))-methyltransferase RsmG [Atopobiaceae]SEH47887.1 16S rRNA m(7)G-527 methyltransferase [Parafannyhessea umbonata]SJZ68618.1 16S rRNA (guanine527-N7)-methyltransferase [Olsenella sp. KH1P3]
MTTEDFSKSVELLQNYCSDYLIDVTDGQAILLLKHLDLVIEKNKVLNLTRIDNVEDGIIRHLVDSLLFLPFVRNCLEKPDDGDVLDIGTGAGFPGIPLAITLSSRVTLLDSVQKKIRADQEFINTLGLSNVNFSMERAELLAKHRSQNFNVCTARAVAETNVLIEYAAPLLKMGGSLVISKGNPSDEEVSDALRVSKICGLELVSRETFELPKHSGHRELMVFTKTSYPSVKLPRKPGDAKRRPL